MKEVITCVIPAYNEESHIARVLTSIPDFVSHIIVVDDASTDDTRKIVAGIADGRIEIIGQPKRMGVGSAVACGYRKAIELGSHVVVKLDGDGQMDVAQMKRLIGPILNRRADYTKGVRFRSAEVVRKMPIIRLIGNLGLSFMTKAASGYWNVFDPTNGYIAIGRTALGRLKIENLDRGYFFETDMLINLYRMDAVVVDVEMRAIYEDERSNLSIGKTLVTFPFLLCLAFIRRILWRYFIFDFSPFSLLFLNGLILFGFGLGFGAYHWIQSYQTNVAATTGTIMLSAVPLILGFQLLLQAAVLDIGNVPRTPLQSEETDL
jgi:dolichol-phosphate mannosyltransferase